MAGPSGAGTTVELEQYRRAVRSNPRDARAHAKLGLTLQKLGHLEEAVASLRRALELAPGLKLHGMMALACLKLGNHQDAVDSYRRALLDQGDDAKLHRGLAEALRGLGQLDEALASARQAVELHPDNAHIHLTLAAVQHSRRDFRGAADAFRRALEITPDNFGALTNLARCLARCGDYASAAHCYRQLIEHNPTNPDFHYALGTCLLRLKQFADAAASLERVLELAPDHPTARHDLGRALEKGGKSQQALDVLLQGYQQHPGRGEILQTLIHVFFTQGHWEDALRYARQAMEAHPDSPYLHSALLFILSHTCGDAAELTREHFAYGERWENPAQWAPHANDRDPERGLQVGFVSADLYHHAVMTFIKPVFERLKHSRQMTLHVYSNNVTEDDATEQLRAHVPSWHSIANLSDEAAEQMIRSHGIDILIDLSGHSARNRLPLFARKPAPIQLTWIGYAGTTGLKAMDYYISDQFHLPPGRYDDQFTEKIARLPLGTPWVPHPNAPPVNPLPALANGYITFGSFNRTNKLSRAVIAAWGHLLRAVPDAKMLMGGLQRGSDKTVLGWFDAEGIDRSRLILRERTTMTEYLKQHYEVDVTLSPFPYTGATTACHALWMGVPTLTIAGATNPTYSTASYLAHLGLNSFITEDIPSFVARGKSLSQDLPALAALRETMRERFTNSLVGYPEAATAGFEQAIRLMWRRWCTGLPADHLHVSASDLLSMLAIDGTAVQEPSPTN